MKKVGERAVWRMGDAVCELRPNNVSHRSVHVTLTNDYSHCPLRYVCICTFISISQDFVFATAWSVWLLKLRPCHSRPRYHLMIMLKVITRVKSVVVRIAQILQYFFTTEFEEAVFGEEVVVVHWCMLMTYPSNPNASQRMHGYTYRSHHTSFACQQTVNAHGASSSCRILCAN